MNTRPTPKRLILSLLSAPSLESVEVGHLIQWGRLFGIEPAATRMAVGRLAREGFIVARHRGTYSMGPAGKLIADTASSWAQAEDRIGPWNQGWIVIHTSHLGRSNKKALRARERAFRLHGFREYVSGLWCRPDNYVQPIVATRNELVSLGLESPAIVMRSSEIHGADDARLARLWPREDLESRYRELLEAMSDSTRRVAGMTTENAARETFLVGEAVIRAINADPLLPAQMVNASARRAMIASMVDYNQLGRSVWERFQREESRS